MEAEMKAHEEAEVASWRLHEKQREYDPRFCLSLF
jgi:hypothetical protein